jgi:hypothetical protein
MATWRRREREVDINGPEMGDGCGVEGKGKVGELS